MLYWKEKSRQPEEAVWQDWARSGHGVTRLFRSGGGLSGLRGTLREALAAYAGRLNFSAPGGDGGDCEELAGLSAEFLSLALAKANPEFVCSKYARILVRALQETMEKHHVWADFMRAQERLAAHLEERLGLALTWLRGLAGQEEFAAYAPYVPEAAALILLETESKEDTAGSLPVRFSEIDLFAAVDGLLSSHNRIENGVLHIAGGDFYGRLYRCNTRGVPGC